MSTIKMFFDIEATAIPFDNLSEDQMLLLENLYRSKRKSVQLKKSTTHVCDDEEHKKMPIPMMKRFLLQNGAFHAGLSRLLCVTIGREDSGTKKWNVISYSDFDEEQKVLLKVQEAFANNYILIGHNIFGYDIPYLQHKFMQHGMKIPSLLQLHGIKPREQQHQDTMQIYRGSQYSNTSLENLCLTLGVETPKNTGLKGSEISPEFEHMMSRDSIVQIEFIRKVAKYCEADVKATKDCYDKIVKVLDVK